MIKTIIIVVAIALVFVFTGTWIFGGLSWLFHLLGDMFSWLEEILNFFGFNKGLIT